MILRELFLHIGQTKIEINSTGAAYDKKCRNVDENDGTGLQQSIELKEHH